MEISVKDNVIIEIREYREEDFNYIHHLNSDEQWNNLVEKKDSTKNAWNNSTIAFVALHEGEIIAYIRGLTDQSITLFICELLIHREFRAKGIGDALLQYVHGLYPDTRIEMLASSTSHTYYEQKGYRPFYGFRKTFQEH
ncbi:GNAT family N-acetyltransferase [Rossellomorea sp. YZS02]|uniref:GNAT family N-acetyltransferase n=1 Tax=Rossellomorea sp. YZS02 TaxID=3097358 RepID=UPI002A0CC56D|nr:GNAT family N-acetyltransferase [Rossellomorea sp. YZS02]MDX8343535.1 GNAT family N-acetyltransferase [Rossellomorea sp. YZS02]